MNEQPLDLRRMLRAVSRRWLVVLVLLWAGCVGGYVVSTRQDPVYATRSEVLLPPSPVDVRGVQLRNIDTQVNIARNGNILERAGRVVDPPVSVRQMRKRIKVKDQTSDILEIRAEAGTPGDAVLLANAVAKEYVAEATAASSSLANTAISGLENQKAKAEADLRGTKARIDAATAHSNALRSGSPERLRQDAIVDNTRLEEGQIALQVSSLKEKIAEASLQDKLTRDSTRLLQPAIRPIRPAGVGPFVLTLGGGLLGLLSAVAVALVLDRRDDRLRSRSEIAEVVGAPVLASLETPRRISAEGCRMMLERWEPWPRQNWALRQACMRLGVLRGDSPSNVVVIGLPGDAAGPLLALQLAVFAASLGVRTAFIVASSHPTAERMRSACHQGTGGSEVRPFLATHSHPLGFGVDDLRAQPELAVTVVIADPDDDELLAIPPRAITTLGVSSGFASADTLAATSLACLDAGHPLVGLFLANPDPSDPTTGDLGLSPPSFFDGQFPLELPYESSDIIDENPTP